MIADAESGFCHFGAPFWKPLAHFGIFLKAFWHVFRTSLTLYDMLLDKFQAFWQSGGFYTVFGSVINGIFLIAFLESGKVHLRIFGRDSPAQIMHAEIRRDFSRNSTGRVLRTFRLGRPGDMDLDMLLGSPGDALREASGHQFWDGKTRF